MPRTKGSKNKPKMVTADFAELKSIDKEIVKLEAKKAKADAKTAEEAKKAEAESVLKKLLAQGVSADEILAKLK